MSFVLYPWQLLLFILAGWVNRQQQEVIEYLRMENQVLKEAHGGRRIKPNDDQRRRLAVKGKILGRKVLGDIWHHRHARYDPALAPHAQACESQGGEVLKGTAVRAAAQPSTSRSGLLG